jgi:hypothetical protein
MRAKLPARRETVTMLLRFPQANGSTVTFYASYGFDHEGRPSEVFCKAFKVGSEQQLLIHQVCMLASLALQSGRTFVDIAHTLGEDDEHPPRSILGAILRTGAHLERDPHPAGNDAVRTLAEAPRRLDAEEMVEGICAEDLAEEDGGVLGAIRDEQASLPSASGMPATAMEIPEYLRRSPEPRA